MLLKINGQNVGMSIHVKSIFGRKQTLFIRTIQLTRIINE